jgi:mono/diheme cytochrome c family protein
LRPELRLIPAAIALAGLSLSAASAAGVDTAGFDKNVKPVIAKTCTPCHSDSMASGGVNLSAFTSSSTVTAERAAWEKIAQKIRTGEMPPRGVPRPPQAQFDALLKYLQTEFQKADANTKPDPGRVTARRLNRSEYSNTIRDLLAVDFRATQDFPTDDSGDGFDNMADVLTLSPLLMEKYVAAAESISSRAVGTAPLPKPVKAVYEPNAHNLRRIDAKTIEAEHRVDFDGDYDVVVGLPGNRAKDAKPVQLGFWMDGKLLKQVEAETKPSGLVYFNPYSEAAFRVFLPEGDHLIRVGFIDDDFPAGLAEKDLYQKKKNKYPETITLSGPFASNVEKASRKKILICDPKSGQACVEKIVATLARRAYRRPVTAPEIAALMKFVALARADGEDTEHGIQLALEAMLVSPHFLFRVERDPNPTDASKVHRISDVELASRLSYFLWSSMPDDELLGLGAEGKLHDSATLDAQVKRMLADARSSALAENFAGQWLEIRNLDSIKPDPDKFLGWGPELKNAMMTETRLFFNYILQQDRPLSEIIDARYTFLNDRLAKFYGIQGVTGPAFRKVELTGDQRGGILSQASVLTVSSYPTRTSPTIRGKYILNNILGTPPPPPPPDVPALDASKAGSEVSLRKQLEEHRANAVCASCHSKMDQLGFGLENYNGIGKWRTMDGKFPIDAGGALPGGKSFTTPAEMKAILLKDMTEFSDCVIRKFMTYALGRGLQPFDGPAVNRIQTTLAARNYPFQDIVFEVVRSLPFQSRRGELITTQVPKPKEIASR